MIPREFPVSEKFPDSLVTNKNKNPNVATGARSFEDYKLSWVINYAHNPIGPLFSIGRLFDLLDWTFYFLLYM